MQLSDLCGDIVSLQLSGKPIQVLMALGTRRLIQQSSTALSRVTLFAAQTQPVLENQSQIFIESYEGNVSSYSRQRITSFL